MRNLSVSATGFTAQTVSASGNLSTIALARSEGQLAEVVVTTAGGIRVRQKELGTANSVIKAESLTAGRPVNVAGGLQGKVAGMQINATSGGVNPNFRVVLRGQRSLTGNNQALLGVGQRNCSKRNFG